jgi:hypothetical protein
MLTQVTVLSKGAMFTYCFALRRYPGVRIFMVRRTYITALAASYSIDLRPLRSTTATT